MTQRKYGALRFVAFALHVLAWVSIILGVLSALGVFLAGAFSLLQLPLPGQTAGGPMSSLISGIIGALASLLVGAIQFVGFLAASQMIYALIDIEQNTRAMADALQRLLALQFAPPTDVVATADAATPLSDGPPMDSTPARQPAEPTITTAAPPSV